MRRTIASLLASLMLAAPVAAQDQPVVVELFTSQGCSSCPPADAFLHKLAEREDVIALALHVDYWDYIGWKDVFANPDYTTRQRSYARKGGRRMIYTPQMVINGQDHVVGNRPMDVTDLIEMHQDKEPSVALTLTRDGDQIEIAATTEASFSDPLTVQLVRYSPDNKVEIKSGENAGRTISYANVVTDLSVINEWDTAAPLEFSQNVEGDQPVVVLVQNQSTGVIEAAAKVN
ncbi:hypothetical protein ROA7450_00124 [Roseovarius albus]|uniref:Secreted protein n=1 Tax=Roseovarius albus TaxID=1247867 RepID=A0A1X6Y6Q7_9RHOB|nr:DUF1223 domain-containing protein [Roseovarius albus]SLN11998.1 hypothetical protein ROA7450_00124 [Roseovarius albus]